MKIKDARGNDITVTFFDLNPVEIDDVIRFNKISRVKFTPHFHTQDGCTLAYIDTNFRIQDVYGMVESIDQVLPYAHDELKRVFREFLISAKNVVDNWEIEDDVDRVDQQDFKLLYQRVWKTLEMAGVT